MEAVRDHADSYMALYNGILIDSTIFMAKNFQNVSQSLINFQSRSFKSVFNSLQEIQISKLSMDNDFKAVEDKVGSGDICVLYHKSRLETAHVNAANNVTKCVATGLIDAVIDFPYYLNFFHTWQDKVMHLPLAMLQDLVVTNPVSKENALIESVWPGSYVANQDALRNEYKLMSDDYYSLVKQSLERVSFPLDMCLDESQLAFNATVKSLRSSLLSQCVFRKRK